MAIIEVKVPQLSESVAEATLLQWRKKPGEAVAIDEVLVEIETDKVVLEVPAPSGGVLAEIVKGDGASCTSDEVIARIDTTAAAGAPAPVPTPDASSARADALAAAAEATPTSAPAQAAAGGAKSGVAMPAAAKLMADHGLAPGSVAGTGREGRVTKGDVLGAIEAAPKVAPAVAPAPAAATPPQPRPLRPRKPPHPPRRRPLTTTSSRRGSALSP